MKRSLELIRHILLVREESDSNKLNIEDFVTEEYDGKIISGHIELLLDCAYIEAIRINSLGQEYPRFWVQRITMFGYEYLDSVRDPNIWDEVKKKCGALLSSASLEIIQAAASHVIMSKLGI